MNKEKNSGGRIRKPQHGRRLRWGKQFILLAAIAVLALGIVGGTSAYLLTNTGNVVNTFTPSRVTCMVEEDFTGTAKSNVKIKNTGDTDAYIRAAIIVNWLDKETGNIVASVPSAYSYSLTENVSGNWKKIGEYFYYKSEVNPNCNTVGSLLTCTVTYPENPEYILSVEILADAIQSSPDNAVQEAWGVTPTQIKTTN